MIDPAVFAGDPPIPADGCCATCGGPRRPERSQRYAPGVAQLDPFCSMPCARQFFNNPLPAGSIWQKPGNHPSEAAA